MFKKLTACVLLAGLAGSQVGCTMDTGGPADNAKGAKAPSKGKAAAAAPLAEKYLLDGELAEAAKSLEARLKWTQGDSLRNCRPVNA